MNVKTFVGLIIGVTLLLVLLFSGFLEDPLGHIQSFKP